MDLERGHGIFLQQNSDWRESEGNAFGNYAYASKVHISILVPTSLGYV
jgi:hypothetical protein